MGRPACPACRRPALVCLCAALPKKPEETREAPLRVVLLQHPQEKKQKHKSDQFLLRTLRGVTVVIGRKLASRSADEETTSAPITLPVAADSGAVLREQFRGMAQVRAEAPVTSEKPQFAAKTVAFDPARTLLLWPAEDAVEPKDAVMPAAAESAPAAQYDTVIAIDATWKYAREMVKGCPILSAMKKVQLDTSAASFLPKPAFLVRKPEKLGQGADEEDVFGFCTAEAVAVFLDQLDQTETPAAPSFYDLVSAPLKLYVERQLSFLGEGGPKHRPDRPGYTPGLFAGAAAGKRAAEDTGPGEPETVAAAPKKAKVEKPEQQQAPAGAAAVAASSDAS